MLNDLDETIKGLLVEGVPLDLSEIDVVFEKPDGEWSASLSRPTVNVYLYHMVENHELRQADWNVSRVVQEKAAAAAAAAAPGNGNGQKHAYSSYNPRHAAIKRRLPFRVDAFYMVTVWANEIEDEHNLLWRVLGALVRYNNGNIPQEKLKGKLAEQEWSVPVKIAQPETPIKNPTDFWSSMEVAVKPGISFSATLPLDPEMAFTLPIVLTRRIMVRNDEAGEGNMVEMPGVQFGGWVLSRDGDDAPGVEGAEVRIVERGLTTITDEEGRFKFDQIPHGSYTLRATADGRRTERKIVLPGEEYDMVLPEAPAATESKVSAASAGDEPPDKRNSGKSRRR